MKEIRIETESMIKRREEELREKEIILERLEIEENQIKLKITELELKGKDKSGEMGGEM
jgi:hypothetical protein